MKTASRVHSFDVFDTVLTRTVLRPKDVFHLLQNRLYASIPDLPLPLRTHFWAARVWAEFVARRERRGEITLGDIYGCMGKLCSVDVSLTAAAMAHELEVEREVLVAVDGAVELVNSCRQLSRFIIFVSDMYLPSTFIRAVLEQNGLFLEHDRLYVSGDLGCTKGSGRLFRHVLQDIGIPPACLFHCGDHPVSDLRVPRALGIQSLGDPPRENGYFPAAAHMLRHLCDVMQARKQLREVRNVC